MYLAIQLIHLLFAKDSLVTVSMEMWLSPHKKCTDNQCQQGLWSHESKFGFCFRSSSICMKGQERSTTVSPYSHP